MTQRVATIYSLIRYSFVDSHMTKQQRMRPLPKGWALAAIKDFCQVNPPKPPADALPADEPVTFVPMPAVSVEGRIESPELRPFGEVRRGSYTPFRDGDVLFAKITPCMENGKGAVAENLTRGIGFGSTEFHVLRPEGDCSARYLHLFLRQATVRAEAARNMSGAVGQLRVPADWTANLQVPLPPAAEQHRIVEKLEELLGHIAHGKAYLDALPKTLKRFRAAVLAAACTGKLVPQNPTDEPASELLKRILAERRAQMGSRYREPAPPDTDGLPELAEGWCWATLGQLGVVERGRFGHRPRNEPRFYDGQYPFIQTGDISNSNGRITSHKQTLNEEGLKISKLFPKGTIVVTIAANIGDSAILTYDCCATDSIVGIMLNLERVLPEFVEFYLRTCKAVLERNAPATAQKNINLQDLNPLPVPLPPYAEQHRIVAKVEELMSLADNIEVSVRAAQRRAERLTQAVLTKAFRGELVPQDPADEPAAVLLERIRAERQRRAEETRAEKATTQRKPQKRNVNC